MKKFLLLFFFSLLLSYVTKSQDYIWAKSLAGRGTTSLSNLTPGTSLCEGLAVDNLNHVYITGYCNDSVDYDPGPAEHFIVGGQGDIFFAKYNEDGNLLWAHVLVSEGNNYATDIEIDGMNNILITGYGHDSVDFDPGPGVSLLNEPPGSANFFFIAKYDSDGNYIWAKGMGGPFGCLSYDLAVDLSNNIYVTGTFSGTADFDPDTDTVNISSNGTGVFFAKYDMNGNLVWAKSIAHVGNLGGGSSIVCSDSGNVFVTGYFGTSVDFDPGAGAAYITASTTADRFFAKYDSSGNFILVKNINVNDDGGFQTSRHIKIVVDPSENIILTGDFSGTVDFDPGAGQTILSSPGHNSTFINKYDISGNFLWAKGIMGASTVCAVALDCNENIYITGSFGGADFDPGPGIYQLISSASSAFMIYFAKYDLNCNFIWARKIGNDGYGGSVVTSVLDIRNGSQFVGGGFKQTGDFDPGADSVLLTASGVGHNVFFAKYSSNEPIDYLGTDTALCEGDTLMLDATTSNATYMWHDNSTGSTFTVAQQGTYWVDVYADCKTDRDSINVNFISIPLDLGDTATLCEGEEMILDATTLNASYVWQDSSSNPTFTVTGEGIYSVQVTVNNCSKSDSVEIKSKECDVKLEMPNVFTPNGDHLNDWFVPIHLYNIPKAHIEIYNRWGQKLFETDNLMKGWDGKCNGRKCADGTYYWIVNYTDINNIELSKTGYVTLIQ